MPLTNLAEVRMRSIAFVSLLLLGLVAPSAARAQLQTGNLYGTLVDEQGSPLPGVTVTLSGQGAPQVQVTNAQGEFRFLGLAPGSYTQKAELEGFSTVEYPNIGIQVGRNTSIEVTLSSAVEDVITVTTEAPLLDERRIATGQTVTETELEKIPTARDPWTILQQAPGVLMDRINVGGNEAGQQPQFVTPGAGAGVEFTMEDFAKIFTGDDLFEPSGPGTWSSTGLAPGQYRVDVTWNETPAGSAQGEPPAWIATPRDPWTILQQTPGVLTDRINVGGNEAGQQSQYLGPGAAGGQSVWAVDGVVITDMGALGSSPAYYDFESFEEMQISTGGTDATIATGGVVLNMVTKRGTNEWRGSGRYLISDEDYGALYQEGVRAFQPTNQDYGAGVGPIIKDRLWIWGSYGNQQVDLLTIPDAPGEAPGAGDAPLDNPTFRYIETMYRRGYTRGCNVPGMNVFTTPGTDCGPIRIQLQNLYGTGAFQGLLPDPFAGSTIHVGVGEPPAGRVGSMIVDPSDPSGNTVYSTGTTGGTWKTDNFLTTDPGGPTWNPVETTWNQARFGDDPTAYKVEDTHIFSSNFYLTGLYSIVNGGFQPVPQGGTTPAPKDDLADFEFHVTIRDKHDVAPLHGAQDLDMFAPGGATGLNFTVLDRKDFTQCPNGVSMGNWQAGDPVDLGNGSSFLPFTPVEIPEACEYEGFEELFDYAYHGYAFSPRLENVMFINARLSALPLENLHLALGEYHLAQMEDALKDEPGVAADPTDELLVGVEHALLPEFVPGLNLTYRQLNNIVEQNPVEPIQLNPAFLNGFSILPLDQGFGGRFRFRFAGGQSAIDQQGPGGSIAQASVSDAPDPTSILLVSLGQSTGEAFRAHIVGDVPASIEGIAVLEPVAAPLEEVTRFEEMMKSAGAVTATVEAYCFQFDGQVPAAGTAYRFAPPEVQKAFEPLARVLEAGQRIKDAGGLVPDTQLDTYFPSISQWAVWTREKGFDMESFGEAWLGHVKKNVEQAGQQMTQEFEQAVRDRIPGRWRDIEKILGEADRMGEGSSR